MGRMKKLFAVILLMFLAFGYAFPQESNNGLFDLSSGTSKQKQAIIFDIFPMLEGSFEGNFGFGLFYEIKIASYVSLVMEFNTYTNFKKNITYSFIGHGRVYPFETTLDKLFFDAGFGYRRSRWETDNVHALTGSLATGWKFIFDNGFLLEPSIGFWHNLYTISGDTSHKFAPIVGTGLGWAF
jgi:hypothetical protein